MKNITFSAPEELIEEARLRAARNGTTLNDEFRKWLNLLVKKEKKERIERFQKLNCSIPRVKTGGPFSREELNER